MSQHTATINGEARALGWRSTLVTIIVIAALAAGLIYWINISEPKAQREGATKRTAMLVAVERVQRGTFAPTITGLGRVAPARELVLSPRVEGRVTAVSDNLLPGGFVAEGERLVRIDPADYANSVQQRESALQQARSELAIELGRRDVARTDLELLDRELTPENRALVLREPQRQAARAAVRAAEAALTQARLELARTALDAPFPAQVLSRTISLGSQVAPGAELARLVGIDEYWVIVTVPVAKLSQIAFPADGEADASVWLRHRTAWPEGESRQGRLRHLIGALDDQTRLARVLVSVNDPLARAAETQGPPMLVGAIVQAQIPGRPLTDVFRIDRDALRENDRLWLNVDGTLQIRDAQVAFKDRQYAYIRDGLDDGDWLVTSNLATVAEGAPLRTEAQEPAQGPAESAASGNAKAGSASAGSATAANAAQDAAQDSAQGSASETSPANAAEAAAQGPAPDAAP
jgi:RND family efflux transporter MFP subunit